MFLNLNCRHFHSEGVSTRKKRFLLVEKRERERERERAICFSTSRGEEIVLAEGLDPRMKNEKRKENGKERVFRDYKTKKDTAKERRKAEAEALNRLRELFPNSKPMELIKVD